MTPGSGGSAPSASAGNRSVPRSTASICITVSGRGTAGTPRQKRHQLGYVRGEDVRDELADVVVDRPSLPHGGDDRREVVVGDHHRGSLMSHPLPRVPIATPMSAALSAGASLTPSPVTATTSSRSPERRTMASLCAGEVRANRMPGSADQGAQRLGRQPVQLFARDHLVDRQADPPGDALAVSAAVAGDDDHADAGSPAQRHRLRHLGARRIPERDQAEQGEVALDRLVPGRPPASPGDRRTATARSRSPPRRAGRAPRVTARRTSSSSGSHVLPAPDPAQQRRASRCGAPLTYAVAPSPSRRTSVIRLRNESNGYGATSGCAAALALGIDAGARPRPRPAPPRWDRRARASPARRATAASSSSCRSAEAPRRRIGSQHRPADPHAPGRHAVLGQRAGLVRADHRGRAQCLHRGEPLHQASAAGHALNAQREREGERRQQALPGRSRR